MKTFVVVLSVFAAHIFADVEPTCDAKTGTCSGAGAPHGGVLVNTFVTAETDRKKLISEATVTLELSERQACDVALLVAGGFSPLTGFMKQADYESVVENMRTKKKRRVVRLARRVGCERCNNAWQEGAARV